MDTTSEEKSVALFTIEQIASVPSGISLLSGCDLCDHCTLLRLMALNRLQGRDGSCTRPSATHVKEYKQ